MAPSLTTLNPCSWGSVRLDRDSLGRQSAELASPAYCLSLSSCCCLRMTASSMPSPSTFWYPTSLFLVGSCLTTTFLKLDRKYLWTIALRVSLLVSLETASLRFWRMLARLVSGSRLFMYAPQYIRYDIPWDLLGVRMSISVLTMYSCSLVRSTPLSHSSCRHLSTLLSMSAPVILAFLRVTARDTQELMLTPDVPKPSASPDSMNSWQKTAWLVSSSRQDRMLRQVTSTSPTFSSQSMLQFRMMLGVSAVSDSTSWHTLSMFWGIPANSSWVLCLYQSTLLEYSGLLRYCSSRYCSFYLMSASPQQKKDMLEGWQQCLCMFRTCSQESCTMDSGLPPESQARGVLAYNRRVDSMYSCRSAFWQDPFIQLNTMPLISFCLVSGLISYRQPSCRKSSSLSTGFMLMSRQTRQRLWQSLRLAEEKGQAVKSSLVQAFMKVLTDLFSMLKKGSRTGNFQLPQQARCSRMWGHPVSFSHSVLMTVEKVLSLSSAFMWQTMAPDLPCSSLVISMLRSGEAMVSMCVNPLAGAWLENSNRLALNSLIYLIQMNNTEITQSDKSQPILESRVQIKPRKPASTHRKKAQKAQSWHPPMHLPKNPQWWSSFSMHTSQSRQCCILPVLSPLHREQQKRPSRLYSSSGTVDRFLIPGFRNWVSRYEMSMRARPMKFTHFSVDIFQGEDGRSPSPACTSTTKQTRRKMALRMRMQPKLMLQPLLYRSTGEPIPVQQMGLQTYRDSKNSLSVLLQFLTLCSISLMAQSGLAVGLSECSYFSGSQGLFIIDKSTTNKTQSRAVAKSLTSLIFGNPVLQSVLNFSDWFASAYTYILQWISPQ